MARLLPTAILGTVLLGGAALSDETTPEPWGRTCALAWCDANPTGPLGPAALEAAFAEAVEVAHVGTGRGCRPPARWPGDQIPASMVLRAAPGAEATLAAWTYPAPPGSEILALCAR